MRNLLFLVLILVFLSPYKIVAQFSGTWTSVENIGKRDRPNKILISSEIDYVTLQKKPKYLFETYSVKIDNMQSPKRIFTMLNQWQDISELYLKNSGSMLSDTDFANLKNIEHIIIEYESGDTNYLENIYKIPNLEKITLIFKEVPKTWDFLYFYKNITSLHIYGNFLSESFYDIVETLIHFPHLTELGLSIDYATDLPKNLNLLGELQILKLYDNLTRINYNHQAQVQPERFNINGVLGNDRPVSFSVLFYSEDYGLTVRESHWIESIWSGKRDIFNPSVDAFASNKGTRNLYILKPKPLFPSDINISTLLEYLYPRSETFTINTTENSIIHTESGCNLFVPAGSLVRKDGAVYSGKAFVSIRYMDDLINSAFRGLDMRVTKYRESPLYRSDVMIEIEISDGVFPLQFSGNMNIRLDMPISDTSSSFYFYDVESKGFLDYELYKSAFYGGSETVQTPIRYDEWLRNDLAKHHYMLDSRSFEDRFRNPDTYFLFDEGDKYERYFKSGKFYTTKEYQWEKNKNTEKSSIKISEGKNLLKISKFSPKIKAKGDMFLQINDKMNLFYELKTLRNVLFKFADTLSNKEFNAAYTRNKRYSDFRVEKDRENGKWQIVLKSDEGYKIIDVEPKFYRKNGKPYSEKKSNLIFSKFNKMRSQRSDAFENFIKQRLDDYSKFYQTRQNSWERKGNFKTVFIKSTGVYGFMSIDENQPERITCFINYLDNNGIPIDVKYLFLIDKSNRNVYQFFKGNTSINLASTSLILCADYKGQLHYIDGDALRTYGLSDGSIYFLRLNSLAHPPRSIEDFKRYIKYDKIK
ncbi:MAG: hypothetical protein J5I91_00415 [Bacteroidetes bacterium]|nr:hypothetical protein [Bacteroidota bacterium]